MDAPTFRTNFPEFSNTTNYTDGQINFWLSVALLQLPGDRWLSNLDIGTQLFIAHHLTLQFRDMRASVAGGAPGLSGGPIAQKAVDKVSYSVDNLLATLKDGGHWNMTTYGVRFLQLARMVGSGGLQLGYPADLADLEFPLWLQ